MRSLLWKEWRENWPTVPSMAVLMAVAFVGTVAFERFSSSGQHEQTVPQWSLMPLLALFWLIPATLASTPAIASDAGSGTLRFLSSLPVSRGKIWWSKLLVALAVYLSAVVSSACVYVAANAVACALGIVKELPGNDVHEALSIWYTGVSLAVPVFSVGIFTSAIAKSAVNAILLLVVSVSVWCVLLNGLITSLAIGFPAVARQNVAFAALTACAALNFFLSYGLFVAAEGLRRPRRYSMFARPLVNLLAAAVSLIICYLWLTH